MKRLTVSLVMCATIVFLALYIKYIISGSGNITIGDGIFWFAGSLYVETNTVIDKRGLKKCGNTNR